MARARYHDAWTMLAVAFLALLASAGIRSAPTALIVPLEQEFGWSRATVSFAVGLQLLAYGLIGPFSAGLAERYGLRRTLSCALAVAVASLAATVFVSAPWHLSLLWGLGNGLATGSAALVLAAIIVHRWFAARRGLAMGILTGSAAAGQLVFLPLLAQSIAAFGWREAVLIASGVAALALPPVLVLLRERPAEIGLKPYGAAPDVPDEAPPPLVNPFAAAFTSLGEVIGTRDFWLLSGSFFVCGASTFGLIGTHFIPACLDHGIPEGTAANILAAMGVFTLLGTIASGWLTDRFDPRWLLFWYYAFRGISLVFLPYAFDLSFWGLTLFGVFYGLDWIATVPPTVRITATVYGLQKAGLVYGWLMVMHQLGAAIFAYAAGLARTEFGDYFAADLVSGFVCIVAALMVLGIGRQAKPTLRPALAAS